MAEPKSVTSVGLEKEIQAALTELIDEGRVHAASVAEDGNFCYALCGSAAIRDDVMEAVSNLIKDGLVEAGSICEDGNFSYTLKS